MFKKAIKKLLLLLINCIVFFISFFVLKSEKIIIVGGWFGQRFADNSKHLFLILNEKKEILDLEKVIWITRDSKIKKELNEAGYESFMVWELKSIWYHLRAKYHFIDQAPLDINSFFSVRAKRINLWHGFPLKKIGSYMGIADFQPKNTFSSFLQKITTRGFWSDHYILTTSDFSANILGKAFGLQEDRIIKAAYPRTYKVFRKNPPFFTLKKEQSSFELVERFKKDGYTIAAYFPTFRDKKETLIFGTDNYNEKMEFLDFCEDRKIKILGKFHYAGSNDYFDLEKEHSALINLPAEADVYTFLSQTDLLITDYSSIYFDYLLWEKPIIFFPYDLEYYRDEDRGFIFDYDEFTPGQKAYNIKELKKILQQDIGEIRKDYEKRYGSRAVELRNKVFSDYNNMEVEYLLNQIRKQARSF